MRWTALPFALGAAACLGCGGARPDLGSGRGGGGGMLASVVRERPVVTTGAAVTIEDDTTLGLAVPDAGLAAPRPGPSIELDIEREAGIGGGGVSVARSSALPSAERRERSRRETARLLALAEPGTAPDTATDATSAPLLVRTGRFHLAVYRVRETIAAVGATAEELGGFVAREGADLIVIRVPVARFDDAVASVSGAGEVLRREVLTTDVTEEFHDDETRIRTLEAMMARVQELLARAEDVAGALAVERELERITLELERLRGRVRYLADRVAYATIAVLLQELDDEDVDEPDIAVLPFHWVRELGLSRLLRLE